MAKRKTKRNSSTRTTTRNSRKRDPLPPVIKIADVPRETAARWLLEGARKDIEAIIAWGQSALLALKKAEEHLNVDQK